MAPLSDIVRRASDRLRRGWAAWMGVREAEASRWRAELGNEPNAREEPETRAGCGAVPRATSLADLVADRQEEARHAPQGRGDESA